jgi:hypothetical protein
MLGVCDECLTNSAHPERLLWPSPFTLTSTGPTMRAEPGQYTIVLMPATGRLMLSTGDGGDDGGCGRYVTLST